VQQKWGIEVPAEDVNFVNFKSIQTIVEYLSTQR
jgi:hypothetical protein